MAQSSEQRRLTRLLNDEDYGPRLARLRGADERRILDLISANKGREARKELVRLDDARRERISAKRRARAFAKQPNRSGKYRPANETRLFWDFYDEAVRL